MLRLLRRVVVAAVVLLLMQPGQAAEMCAYSCTVIRWAAKNFSKEKIERAVATAAAGQLAACRKCLRNNQP